MHYFQIRRTLLEEDFEPDIYGIPQLDVDQEIFSMFTSKTNRVFLRNLLHANCFSGEATASQVASDLCVRTE